MASNKRHRPSKRSKPRREVLDGNPPTVRLKSNRYQPTKAELEEEVRIPTTPQRLAKAVVRTVKIKHED